MERWNSMSFKPKESGDSDKRPPRRGGRNKRRKICYFTENKITHIDYKNTDLLKKFVSDRRNCTMYVQLCVIVCNT